MEEAVKSSPSLQMTRSPQANDDSFSQRGHILSCSELLFGYFYSIILSGLVSALFNSSSEWCKWPCSFLKTKAVGPWKKLWMSYQEVWGWILEITSSKASGESLQWSGLCFLPITLVPYPHWSSIHHEAVMKTRSPSYVCPQRQT